jgi:membrane protein YdbS with pleckstrin-like domain
MCVAVVGGRAGTLRTVPISRRALADDEEVLVDLRPHWVFFVGPAALAALAVAVAIAILARFPKAPVAAEAILAAVVALPALWFVGRMVRWLGISLVVTTARLLYRQGVLGRDLVQLRLQRVTEVHCTQTFVERLVRSGRLVVDVVGEGAIVVDDIRSPRALQRVITRQLDELQGRGIRSAVALGQDALSGSPGTGLARELVETPPHGIPVSLPDRQLAPIPGARHLPSEPLWTSAPEVPADQVGRMAMGPAPGTGTSISDQLVALDGLRRRGIITEDEFAVKKSELLSRL